MLSGNLIIITINDLDSKFHVHYHYILNTRRYEGRDESGSGACKAVQPGASGGPCCPASQARSPTSNDIRASLVKQVVSHYSAAGSNGVRPTVTLDRCIISLSPPSYK